MAKRGRRFSPGPVEHAAREPDRQELEVDSYDRAAKVVGNLRWTALVELGKAAEHEKIAVERRHRAVALARARGASWSQIAEVLGVSRQAVRQRYGTDGE